MTRMMTCLRMAGAAILEGGGVMSERQRGTYGDGVEGGVVIPGVRARG